MFRPEFFNADHSENDSADTRSDNKGPEPEGLDIGTIHGRTYAFVGLERNSGIAVADVTDPEGAAGRLRDQPRQLRGSGGRHGR